MLLSAMLVQFMLVPLGMLTASRWLPHPCTVWDVRFTLVKNLLMNTKLTLILLSLNWSVLTQISIIHLFFWMVNQFLLFLMINILAIISISINDRHIIEILVIYIKEAICWLASLYLVIVKPMIDYTWLIVFTCMAVKFCEI